MKNSNKCALALFATLTFGSFADGGLNQNSSASDRELLKNYNERHKQYAHYLQLTETQYHHALSKYLELMSGVKNGLKPLTLNSHPEIEEAQLYFDQNKALPPILSDKINEIVSTQLLDYSEYLGIPINKLREFEIFVGEQIDMQKVASNFNTGDLASAFSDEEPETIVITCDAQCVQQAQITFNFKQLYFAQWASNAGVSQFESFYVRYPTYPTQSSHEEWRYNNFSGAWFRGVVEMCGDVVCKK
ncbi:hypothetical protein WG68_12315 [Arsukibacterium ikkense]|uniref:Uncharacterized protein n=1 Tax=Arsukibacterium ikkense TaxID=336831 RepID=A0A0M2V471_9GAMM|nr:hypothetical protein [Arsukibacterium ikkense]KKO45199.1 hypothetical protein WG68_12315 [Arsukibacterium ikkense]